MRDKDTYLLAETYERLNEAPGGPTLEDKVEQLFNAAKEPGVSLGHFKMLINDLFPGFMNGRWSPEESDEIGGNTITMRPRRPRDLGPSGMVGDPQ